MIRKPYLRWALAVAGIVAPVILVTYFASQHGMLDFIRDYLPLKRNMYILLGASLLTFVALGADILERRNRGLPAAISGALTWAMAIISISLCIAFASYVFIPMVGGSGDTPPQLMMVESQSPKGMPGLAVVFYTDKPTKNTIVWGQEGVKLFSIREKEAARKHWFRLRSLKPDTEYMYAVNNRKPVWFRTPPGDGQPIWFAVGGDAHVGNQTSSEAVTKAMLEQIAKPTNGYDAFFLLGDMTQLGFSDNYWRDAGREFGPYTQSIPTAILPGNHDTMLGGLPFYEKYQEPPGPGAGQDLWQRIDIGKVHFLLLDLEWELQTYTPAQKTWLIKELETLPKDDWKIVMCHTFFYSSGAYEDGWPWYDNKSVIKELSPVFEKYGVDIVMSGHKHDNEILRKNGVTYVVTGAFGGEPDKGFDYISPASVWLKKGAYAFADVTINGGLATISFIDQNGNTLYRTTIKR
jgi:acid phosphatase type 7